MRQKLMTIFLTAVLSGVILIAQTEAVEQNSLRELLVASENTEEVFVIDDYHTFVRPKLVFFGIRSGEPSEDLSKEIVAACTTQMEVNTKQTDPITKKIVETWIPYDGKSYIFHRIVKDNVTGEFHSLFGAKCNGNFEITITYTDRSKGLVRSFVIKHEKPQPFIFKTEHISPDKITMPADGEFKLVSIGIGGFLKALAGRIADEEAVIHQYVTALCRNNNGKIRFVINRGKFVPDPKGKWTRIETGEKGRYEGEYVETDALEAFNYAKTASSIRGPVYKVNFYACEGNNRFIVRSEEEIKYDNRGNAYGTLKSYFASQKGLDGLKYVPLSHIEKSETPQTVGPQLSTNTEEQIAVEVANKGINIFKVFGAQEYTGIYNGKDQGGCDLVTVEKNWDASAKKPRVDTYNYKICNGVIAKASETDIETLPRGIEVFMQKMARIAQKLGSADGDYQGYTVKAQAVRDKDQCSVEIKVLKDINLVAKKIVNGCQ